MKRIESRQNALVKHWLKLITNKKDRDKSGEFLVEGFHLVEEALKTPGTVLHLIVRDDVELPPQFQEAAVQQIEIPTAIAKELSETEHSQGIFAHCRQPQYEEDLFNDWKKLLFIDAVQDPGNVGTMIRTADAAGIDAVIIGHGSADLYNPKTIRSAQGSNFHLPVVKGSLEDWVKRAKTNAIPVLGTGLHEAKDFQAIQTSTSFALLVGNEGSGVSQELLKEADEVVKIPILGQAESLNVAVATGILLYAYAVSGNR
ncbi:RNA methyltransferase [Sporosarcina sp. Te-1]|uniref:TrmH family RNA methyltransferase n=1 Tax=Sporosarcina sp. Te-1 TaxID=2818390 RepID=UPI001A9F2371|nr:RNA methyltransferase [Sporosarcina sp. Te-1]QTD41489.1 RNA methyltransferase [Sporosarcina sp. Te-1]